jgi:TrmH family RNA methyltransferase
MNGAGGNWKCKNVALLMLPLSKAKLKLFRSLLKKKHRKAEGLFLIAGRKLVQEALGSAWPVEWIIVAEHASAENWPEDKVLTTDEATLRELSGQVHPEGVVAVVRMPGAAQYAECKSANEVPEISGMAFLLQDIQDPGNLGTLIRTADWMGFSTIVCSQGTVDAFNPKVLRSSMGSIFRVQVFYVNEFAAWVEENAARTLVADMQGTSPGHIPQLDRYPFVLLGNEANGVHPDLAQLPGIIRVSIPRFGAAESLNVATAGAILAWEMAQART